VDYLNFLNLEANSEILNPLNTCAFLFAIGTLVIVEEITFYLFDLFTNI